MSTKKNGMVTVSGEWARHLRPWGRQQFWSGERNAAQRYALAEAHEALQVPNRVTSAGEFSGSCPKETGNA